MRSTARAFIIKNHQILLIHRIKEDQEYYVVPGGGIEVGEAEEQTVKREIQEELSLTIVIDKKIGTFMNGDDPVTYFLIKEYTGTIAIGKPEKERISSHNMYLPEWISIDSLDNINLVPTFVKEIIKKHIT